MWCARGERNHERMRRLIGERSSGQRNKRVNAESEIAEVVAACQYSFDEITLEMFSVADVKKAPAVCHKRLCGRGALFYV